MGGRQVYALHNTDLTALIRDLNFHFQDITNRLDAIEGRRGQPAIYNDLNMNNNYINSVAGPAGEDDAVPKSYLVNLTTTKITVTGTSVFGGAAAFGAAVTMADTLTLAGAATFNGSVKIVNAAFTWEDVDGVVIHEFGA